MENTINKDRNWDEDTMKRLNNLTEDLQKTANGTTKIHEDGVPWFADHDRNGMSGNNSWAMLYAGMEQKLRALDTVKVMRENRQQTVAQDHHKTADRPMPDNTTVSASNNVTLKKQD
ncbi:hypothetical protein KCU93_g5797, partial [Aureobasidium melanogenum]